MTITVQQVGPTTWEAMVFGRGEKRSFFRVSFASALADAVAFANSLHSAST